MECMNYERVRPSRSLTACMCACEHACMCACMHAWPTSMRVYISVLIVVRLPGECVNATSVNMFKNKIDNYFIRSGYV